jgi:hypothetical protein
VALRFKLLSLEYLSRVKERFFESSLLERIRLFDIALQNKGFEPTDLWKIKLKFSRELPFEGQE